ncbi:MAG: hypothetical protein HY703_00175 [Gemmatimonadetes bacterium]|nr:hypothetical protein [Gemmatimonadota bacterium]
MLAWLVPFCVFWTVVAIYVGGTGIRIEGGTPLRQLLGLVAALVLFLAIWGVARALLRPVLPAGVAVVVPTLMAVLLLPLSVWAGFRVFGVRVDRGTGLVQVGSHGG